jgi:hypothetical protein|tara:strand:+ start:1025 stop:1408 length:384 start_codon:yes stop_codon:yes gene_type:complete
MESLLDSIDKERDARFMKPWAKLDKGSRLNRITHFVESEAEERQLSEAEELDLKETLRQLCDTGLLTKASEVSYSEGEQRILALKRLVYEETTRIYTYTREEKKTKSSHKSRSNVDRHFTRAKENNS